MLHMGAIGNKKTQASDAAHSPRVIRPEWLARFKEDARVHLNEISGKLAALPLELGQTTTSTKEKTEAEQQIRHEIYRRAHSMKGSASMVGLTEIANKARQLEELLKKAYEEPAEFDSSQRSSAEQLLEGLRQLLIEEL